MKFIHTADIHWGMRPDSDKPWGKQREQAIRLTFQSIIDQAHDRHADLLLIAGDLFHRQPLSRDLKEINYLFTTIPDTRVVIIAGNHDRIRPSSALYGFSWAPNVTFLMDESTASVYFEDLDTEVFGFSYHTAEITEPRADYLKAADNSRARTKILLLHGGDARHLPFSRDELAATPYTYIALGHIHRPQLLIRNRMAFPGSPEPLDVTETGEHGYIYGETDPDGGMVTRLDFISAAMAQYIPLMINVVPGTTNAELSHIIADEIEKRGSQNIFHFRIRGTRDPDVTFDTEYLAGRWRISGIVDESEPLYDFHALLAEHPDDMIGFYIRSFLKDEMSPLEKKAMYYGIHALLMTQDERSRA